MTKTRKHRKSRSNKRKSKSRSRKHGNHTHKEIKYRKKIIVHQILIPLEDLHVILASITKDEKVMEYQTS